MLLRTILFCEKIRRAKEAEGNGEKGKKNGNQLGGSDIAKLLLLLFEENEDKVLNTVMSALGNLEEKIQLTVKTKLIFQGIEIDVSGRLVYRDGKEIKTTFREFEILYLLASNPGRVFSKEQIYDIVWQEPYSGDYNIVMSHIRHIREKIEDNPAKPLYIQTVWGIGYRFNKNVSSSL